MATLNGAMWDGRACVLHKNGNDQQVITRGFQNWHMMVAIVAWKTTMLYNASVPYNAAGLSLVALQLVFLSDLKMPLSLMRLS